MIRTYKTKRYIKVTMATMATLCLTSCSDFLEEYSQDLAKVESWRDLDEVLLGDGYLQPTRARIENSTYYYDNNGDDLDFLHFMTDEMVETGGTDNVYNSYNLRMFPFYTWQQDTGMDEKLRYVGGDATYFNMLYDKINVCNMVISLIDRQPEADRDDAVEKERVKGEAHFLRAAYYMLLANIYAKPYAPDAAATTPGVPMKVTEYVEDKEYLRYTLAENYERIIADLDVAEQCLQNKTRKSVYHANLTATYLLQSRVYLYMQNWAKAAEYASKTLSEQDALLDLHTLTPGNDCIYASSPETIFSMGGYLISIAFADGRWDDVGYRLSDDMLQLYSRDDLRSKLYVGTSCYGSGEQNVFMKVNGQSDHWGNYYTVSSYFLMRTPEAYLTLAEASAFNGDEATARQALEKFLNTRMNSKPDVTVTGNSLIDLIRNERAREFLLEGHRWFDLRRYTVCTPYKWSKTIEHPYHYYADYELDYADHYRLEENDGAYTLPFPREIRNFQISIGNNERPARKPFFTQTDFSSGDDDDWDW